jgi:hypothetical protein
MARIKINDLPKDMKISANELRAIRGGKLRSPTGIIIESGGSHELEQHMLWAPLFRGTGVGPAAVGPACGGVGRRY